MRGAGAVSRCLSHPKRKARRVREPVRRSGLGIAGLRGPGPAASQLLGFVVRDRGRGGAAAAVGSRAGPKQPAGGAPGARGSAAAGRAPTRPRRPQRKGVWESARGGGGSLSPGWGCLEPRAPQTRPPPAPPPGSHSRPREDSSRQPVQTRGVFTSLVSFRMTESVAKIPHLSLSLPRVLDLPMRWIKPKT